MGDKKGEEEMSDPGSFAGFTGTSAVVGKRLHFQGSLCATICRGIPSKSSLSHGLILCFFFPPFVFHVNMEAQRARPLLMKS